jgi:TonB family protein
MISPRPYRRGWTIPAVALFVGAVTLAINAPLAAYLVDLSMVGMSSKTRLDVVIVSASETGGDSVLLSVDGEVVDTCTNEHDCQIRLPEGTTRVELLAFEGPKSVFAGYEGCVSVTEQVLRCTLDVHWDEAIKVSFAAKAEEVEVAMLPDVMAPLDPLELPETPEPPTPREEIEAETLDEPIELAVVPPLPPDFVPPPIPPPPPPPEEKKAAEPPPQPPPDMRSVEVPDENEVEEAPDDATHLSDKNRDVAEETAAKDTNLEKEKKGEEVASAPSQDQSEEIGGEEADIAQLEESEATTSERVEASDHSGEADKAEGAIVGEAGDDGEEGTGEKKEPGMLAMRGIEGRGSVTEQGGDGKKKGRKGKKGMKTQLEFDDYERIVGTEKAEKERAIAQRDRSMKKGRYKKKLEAIKSALENFTPDVRPGNQTALKTRAHPFALYLARMHRRIHELWGFGFLEDLDGKSADHELNDFDLFTSIEVAINPDGSVYKMTVAKASGQLEFDVAALHTIEAAAPYEQTPEKIRSVDQRVYLRWGFYRNWRQCGTFNVEPYILTEIPGGVVPLDAGMDTTDGKVSAADAADPENPVTPEPAKGSGASGEDHSHAHVHAGDNEAKYTANMWIAGLSNGSVDKMLKVSAVPFYAGSEVAASDTKQLREVYEGLLVESGKLKDWDLLTPERYAEKVGTPVQLAEGSLILLVRTKKEAFALVLSKTKAGEYRVNAIVR